MMQCILGLEGGNASALTEHPQEYRTDAACTAISALNPSQKTPNEANPNEANPNEVAQWQLLPPPQVYAFHELD